MIPYICLVIKTNHYEKIRINIYEMVHLLSDNHTCMYNNIHTTVIIFPTLGIHSGFNRFIHSSRRQKDAEQIRKTNKQTSFLSFRI